MNEREAQTAVRPLAPAVHTLPSERPETTHAQKTTLEHLARTHDEVGELRINPDGVVLVTLADYTETGRWEADVTISRDGIPL